MPTGISELPLRIFDLILGFETVFFVLCYEHGAQRSAKITELAGAEPPTTSRKGGKPHVPQLAKSAAEVLGIARAAEQKNASPFV